MFEYDEEEAVKFIQNHLPQEMKERFSDDDIYYILDVICEFYEENDYLNEDDEEKEEKELIRFILQQSQKDKIGEYTSEEILMVLRAEEAYSEELDIPE